MKLGELTDEQFKNAKLIDAALVEVKLKNPFLRAGILAVCSKESGFIPKGEISYSGTPASRIRKIFPLKFQQWTDLQIDALKKDERAFFNHVYNRSDLGNLNAGDGYKYRGRGFNQTTGYFLYNRMGKKIMVDLVNNPDRLMEPEVAAKVCAVFMYDSIVQGQTLGLFAMRYKIWKTDEIKTIELGATIAHQANMGWKYTPDQDPTGGFEVTMADAPSYLTLTTK